tara:strand:- start:46 stop:2184 length:2139 start_codon:yes stop_codon:yes gene_type:complete
MADDISLIIGVDDRDLIRTQKEQKKFERNLLIIEAAMRKGDISARRYSAELNKQAKQLSRLGGTYAKANSEVRSYAATLRKTTDDQLKLAMATNVAGKSTNKFGMYAQQVGYQVGDFFVQVQSGTSALVAFGQQGTQLAGLLPGVYGAVIGISLAIGTMLLRSFMDVNSAAKKAAEEIKAFEEALKKARSEIQGMRDDLVFLQSGFENTFELTFTQAIDKATDKLGEAEEKLEVLLTKQALLATGAAGGITFSIGGFGKSAEDKVEDAKEAVKLAKLELINARELARQAKQRARDEAITKSLGVARQEQTERELDALEKAAAEEEKIAQSQTKRFESQRDALKLKTLQVNLEQRTEDKLLIQQAIELRKIELQHKSGEITRGQALELSALTRELINQKTNLKELTEAEKARLALIKLQVDLENKRGRARDKIVNNLEFFDPRNESGLSGVVVKNRDSPQKSDKKGGKTPAEKLAEEIKALQDRATLENKLVGLFDNERDVKSELIQLQQEYGKLIDKDKLKEIQYQLDLEQAAKKQQQALQDTMDRQKEFADLIANSMGNSMMSIVEGTQSVKDAFRSMAADIVKHLYKVLVVQQMIKAIGGAVGGPIGGALEDFSFDGGGYTGSGPRSGGLDGRGGFMAMMHPQETVVDHTKGQSAGGDNVVINQSFNFAANGDDSVKKIIAQAAPQIAQMTKNSMLNDRRRGGTTKAVFG